MEILAPAGGMDSVIAAVQNRADAVYFGGKKYNARVHADNFDREAFAQAVAYCHLYGVKVYQTLNTLLYDEELDSLFEDLKFACDCGVDALIVQDFGVIAMARACCPDMPIHGSTQMTVHTVAGAKLCKELGMTRVVLARELSLKEIAAIKKEVDIELEVFGHGALCMSVSGQCYMSAMIGTRSGNRGSCAGTCRLPFGLEKPTDYDLSLKDLSAADQVSEMQRLGIASFKIEGRMKRPEYVAAAVSAYAALKQQKYADLSTLEAVFSRSGFTDGYLTGHVDGEMFGVRGKEDVMAATEPIFAQLRQTYHKPQAYIGITMSFTMLATKPASLTVSDGTHEVTVCQELAQVAKNRPTDEQMAKEALGKLGGTPFYLEGFSATIGEGLMAPKSALNELRRRAIDELSEKRQAVTVVSCQPQPKEKAVSAKISGTMARFRRFEQADFDAWDAVILPLEEVVNHLEEVLPYADLIWLELSRVLFGCEEQVKEWLIQLQDKGFAGIACQNPAHIQLGRELGYPLFGMPFLNVTNSKAASFLAGLGVESLILSTEMTAQQGNRVHAPIPLGNVVYGRLPLMIVRNCPLKRHGGCGSCNQRRGLTDRLGEVFPVRCHNRRYAEVFNSKTLWMSDRQNEVRGLQLYYFTEESAAQIEQIRSCYRQGGAPMGEFTRGLYYRKTT